MMLLALKRLHLQLKQEYFASGFKTMVSYQQLSEIQQLSETKMFDTSA